MQIITSSIGTRLWIIRTITPPSITLAQSLPINAGHEITLHMTVQIAITATKTYVSCETKPI